MWRVRERRTFDAFRRRGVRGGDGPLTIVHLPPEADPVHRDADTTPPRVAYAVGRSVGPAVVRNRLRRRLRAIMTEVARDDGLPRGAYLILTRPGADLVSYDELRGHVRRALARIERRMAG